MSAESDYQRLHAAGFALPNEPIRARMDARRVSSRLASRTMAEDVGPMSRAIGGESAGRRAANSIRNSGHRLIDPSASAKAHTDVAEMMGKRRASRGSGSSTNMAYPKERDPFEYWRDKTWWFDLEDPDEHLSRIRDWARLMYTTHSLVPSLIDIYTRFPLLDIEFKHKDDKLVDFYSELFFDGLNYHDHLFDMGREHWITGEVFSLATWHDGIGAWEDEEIINPNDVVVAKNRALRTNEFMIKVPEEIKRLIETQEPRAEYQTLLNLYPDLVRWAKEDKEIPVSDVLMKQIKFKTNPWSSHGTPILLRAFRQLMLEESLNAAQDAVADRLYSPLILAQLGLDNVDEEGPWIPDADELDQLRNDLDVAINSDFRLMVYHHGLNIQSVFGRETMPRLDMDFDRVDGKVMQVFGIGAELLSGGKSGATYASGALNRELITQMLETYQVHIRRFIKERMEVVAERQGHYEYRKVGDQRVPIMETVLMVDEETGEEYIEERPKLAVPDVQFKSMNLRDEQVERGFMMELKQMGFPVSNASMAVNVPIEFEEELERSTEEQLDMIIAQQQFKMDLFERLDKQGLPIPPEMVGEYMSWKQGVTPVMGPDGQVIPPTPNVQQLPPSMPGSLPSGEPTPNEMMMEEEMPPGSGSRPEISDEMRASMPRASKTASTEESTVEGKPLGEGVKISYGNRMRFGSPIKARKKMSLPNGIVVAARDEYQQDEGPDAEEYQPEVEKADDTSE